MVSISVIPILEAIPTRITTSNIIFQIDYIKIVLLLRFRKSTELD